MRKLLKILGWIVGIVAVLLVLLIVAVQIFFPVEKAKEIAVRKGSEALGRQIDVEGVDLSIWGGLGIELQGVSVANPTGWPGAGDMLTADKIDVKLQLLPLLSSEYRLSRLIIDNPVILLRKNADGSNNYSFTVTDTAQATRDMPAEARPAAAVVSFDRLEINGGRIEYVDDSAAMTVLLTGVDLNTSLSTPRTDFYKTKGQLSINQASWITTDTVPPVELQLRYEASYDLARKNLLLEDAQLKVNDLAFALTGEVDHAESTIARAHVRSDNINVKDLFSLMPKEQLTALEGFDIDGDFSFEADAEYAAAAAEPLTYSGNAQITKTRLAYRDVKGELKVARAMIDFKNNNARLNIEDATFDGKPLKGHMLVENFDNPTVNGEISGDVDLVFIKPFLPAENNPDIAGDAAFSIKVSGPIKEPTELALSGDLAINHGRYASDQFPEPIDTFTVDAYFDNRLVKINTLNAVFQSGSIGFVGRINDLIPYVMADSTAKNVANPSVDGTLKGKVDLAMAQPFLPDEGDPKLAGMLDMNITLNGDVLEPSGLKIRGNVSVANGSFTDTLLAEPINHFETHLTMVPDTIRIDKLIAQFRTSDLSLTGTILRPFPYLLPMESIDKSKLRKPEVVFAMTSHRFNVDSLFPETSPTGADTAVGTAEARSDTIPPFILPKLDGRGVVSFDTVFYMNVPFTNLNGDVTIDDNVVSITNVTGNVYSGDVTGKTSIDFSQPARPVYDGSFDASQIEANDFISRFTDFGGHLFGKLDLKGQYAAAGWEKPTLMNSLSMDGVGQMKEAKMVTSGAMYKGLAELGKLVGQDVKPEESLRNVMSKVIVRDGKVQLDQLTSRLGSLGDVAVSGYYGFDGELKYDGSILLSEETTQKVKESLGAAASAFKGVQRLKLPLTIGGTTDDPQLKLDLGSVTDQAKQNLLDQAGNKIKDLFKKK